MAEESLPMFPSDLDDRGPVYVVVVVCDGETPEGPVVLHLPGPDDRPRRVIPEPSNN